LRSARRIKRYQRPKNPKEFPDALKLLGLGVVLEGMEANELLTDVEELKALLVATLASHRATLAIKEKEIAQAKQELAISKQAEASH